MLVHFLWPVVMLQWSNDISFCSTTSIYLCTSARRIIRTAMGSWRQWTYVKSTTNFLRRRAGWRSCLEKDLRTPSSWSSSGWVFSIWVELERTVAVSTLTCDAHANNTHSLNHFPTFFSLHFSPVFHSSVIHTVALLHCSEIYCECIYMQYTLIVKSLVNHKFI